MSQPGSTPEELQQRLDEFRAAKEPQINKMRNICVAALVKSLC
jgi:hypothetical protein